MGLPARNLNDNNSPRKRFGVIQGGGETTGKPEGNLKAFDPNPVARTMDDAEKKFGVIQGGGETTDGRGDLKAVDSDDDSGRPLNDTASMENEAGANSSLASDAPSHSTEVIGKRKNRDGSTQNISRNPKAKSLLRKTGPLIGVGGIGALLITALMGSVGLSSMIVNIKELAMERWDTRSITAESRSNRILAKRLGESTTKGCGVVKRACRYGKPSNKFLRNLEASGIKAVDADGNVIKRQSWIDGKSRPAKYILPDGLEIEPKGFEKAMRENRTVSAAFRKAHNPRWTSWSDRLATKFFRARGLNKAPPDIDSKSTDVKSASEKVGEISKGESLDGDAVKAKVHAELDSFGHKAARKLKGLLGGIPGPADAVSMVCLATSTPGAITKAIRAVKAIQLIKYGMVILTTADAIKDGTVTEDQVIALGNILTAVVNSKSAMDSFGMRNLLMGDINPNGEDYKRFVIGGEPGVLSSFNSIRNNQYVKDFCELAYSPEAQLTEDAVMLGLKGIPGVGWAAIALDIGAFIAEKTGVTEAVMNAVIGSMLGMVKELLPWDAIIESMVGDITANLAGGVDPGNAGTGGIANALSEIANEGGGGAMQTDQAQTFFKEVAQPIKLAWAEEAKATLSPFDASSPHTFLGTIATQLIPYQSKMSTISGSLSTITTLASKNLAALLSPTTQAYNQVGTVGTIDPKEFSLCPDPDIQTSKIASTPWCTPYYGVPSEYLGIDPGDVLIDLRNRDQIDEEGEIIPESDLAIWIDDCNSNDTSMLASCLVDSQEKANYLLYQIDGWQLEAMDEEFDEGELNISSDPTGTIIDTPSKDGWSHPLPGVAPGNDYHAQASKGLHKGIDFPAPAGTAVLSAHDGTVTKIKDQGSCGMAMIISAEGVSGIWHAYQHARPLDGIQEGTAVKRGQTIARVQNVINGTIDGIPGVYCASGPHLHFSIETRSDSVSTYSGRDYSRNPRDYLPL